MQIEASPQRATLRFANRRWRSIIVAAIVCAMMAGSAAAQPSDARAAAELLFNEARTLAEGGNHTEACPKFEASLRLDPALGTRLNLATCYEAVGKLASAWAMFKSAADGARLQGDVREKLANERAARLQPRLPRLSVRVDGKQPAGMTIVRSGSAMEQAMLGFPTFVDPGRIEITATAPGHETFSTTVVAKEGAALEVVIPPLQARRTPGDAQATETETPKKPGGSRQRWIGAGVVGGGAALLAGSLGIGYSARSLWNDAFDSDECDRSTLECSPAGQKQTDRARTRVLAANVIGAAGIAAMGVGAYLYFTSPKAEAASTTTRWIPTVEPGHVGIAAAGAF